MVQVLTAASPQLVSFCGLPGAFLPCSGMMTSLQGCFPCSALVREQPSRSVIKSRAQNPAHCTEHRPAGSRGSCRVHPHTPCRSQRDNCIVSCTKNIQQTNNIYRDIPCSRCWDLHEDPTTWGGRGSGILNDWYFSLLKPIRV